MKYYLLLLVFCFGLSPVFAQYNWTSAVITLKDGKILTGEAFFPMQQFGGKEKLRFRETEKKKRSRTNPQFFPNEVEHVVFTVNYKKKRIGKSKNTNEEKYIPIFLNKKETRFGFAQLIVDGKLKLVARTVIKNNNGGLKTKNPVYSSTFGFLSSHNEFLFLKEKEKPKVFTSISLTKSFSKRAIEYFSDCDSLTDKIENKVFKKEDLKEIVNFYNTNCN